MLKMTAEERAAFLQAVRIGVLSIPNPGHAPLTAPIWYCYEPTGELWVILGRESKKGRLIAEGTPVTLVAQDEGYPYSYVSVEGRVAGIRPADRETDTLRMAERYLGKDGGRQYVDSNPGADSLRVSIEPTRWLSVDYRKMGGA